MQGTPFELLWEGFVFESYEVVSPYHWILRLKADHRVQPICSGCGQACSLVHDTNKRSIRERDMVGYQVWLEVPIRRVRCATCGPRVERLAWVNPGQRLTTSMVNWVENLVRIMPVKHVADLLNLHWHTVKSIDKRRLERELPPPDKSRIRRLVMDEFALYKGHRYATVAMDADTQQVLWVGQGRSRKAIRPFFEWLGKDACNSIKAVAMDMNSAMDLEVKKHCPKASIVYDLFHVVAKFGREVVDRVRVDQANQLRHDKPARKVIKNSRWLLLRNPSNLNTQQGIELDELLQANKPLMTVYLLKNQLKQLWYAKSKRQAIKRWREWFKMALSSGLQAVISFARNLKKYLHGIISSAKYPLNTSILEGMNNRIKVLKRTAYGYRDTDYFFLKIKDAFPGKAR